MLLCKWDKCVLRHTLSLVCWVVRLRSHCKQTAPGFTCKWTKTPVFKRTRVRLLGFCFLECSHHPKKHYLCKWTRVRLTWSKLLPCECALKMLPLTKVSNGGGSENTQSVRVFPQKLLITVSVSLCTRETVLGSYFSRVLWILILLTEAGVQGLVFFIQLTEKWSTFDFSSS